MTKNQLRKIVRREYWRISFGNGYFNTELETIELAKARTELWKWRDYALQGLITENEFIEQLDNYWKVLYDVTLNWFVDKVNQFHNEQNEDSDWWYYDFLLGGNGIQERITNRHQEQDFILRRFLDWQRADGDLRPFDFIWAEEIFNLKEGEWNG